MFCSNCGKQIPDNTKFCNHCGAPQVTNSQSTPAPCVNAEQPDQKPAKTRTKTIIGIILICLQCVAIYGRMSDGKSTNLADYFPSGAAGFFEILGFLLMGIIGVVLLVWDFVQKKK